jgi:hypothetical protein
MILSEFEEHVRSLGYVAERTSDGAGAEYLVIRSIEIPRGALKGRVCDVALQAVATDPFVVPAALHVRPIMLPMRGGEPYGTQASPLGDDWQYWSRRLDRPPTPEVVWAHVMTVLTEVPAP